MISAKHITQGNKDYSLLVFKDIGAIQNFELRKQQARFDKQYTSCLSHDMLTPLNQISGINMLLRQQIEKNIKTDPAAKYE